ncbi:MIP/aquaporin family protein [Plantactinospora sp. KBS50]|uniref:MIP/aquaporin family protein n=1 Tax=Plantactinospora sp. KBS50 TaxID=2024580 RepID=UPI000BAB0EF3|nr:aquaporin [Plantactinospora sp. KBS50]ASW53822.1 aquaporin [Plantactinospora sp. KBS50]
MESPKRYASEFLGTLLLVFFGVGSAIAALVEGGVVVVALTFGFILLVLAYVLGPVSGSHFNPAVTLGVLISGKITLAGAIAYWIAQLLGSVVASFILWALVHWGGVTDQTGRLGANSYGTNINMGGTMVLEIIISFLFVLVVLVVTSRKEYAGFAGLVMGVALAVVHLVATTLDGTSVNPARSFGPALFNGGTPLTQLWLFILFPLLGGLLAALVSPLILSGPETRHGPHHPDSPPPPRPSSSHP